jgi:DNA-binding NtrC family response regulator
VAVAVPPGAVVLVVEDEFLIRENTAEFVRMAGFEPIEARNADEALKILESRSDIRIVFTDINMPGSIDGLKLAHAVRGRWPPIKVIVTSGRDLPLGDAFPDGAFFLPKPYAYHQMLAAFQHVATA